MLLPKNITQEPESEAEQLQFFTVPMGSEKHQSWRPLKSPNLQRTEGLTHHADAFLQYAPNTEIVSGDHLDGQIFPVGHLERRCVASKNKNKKTKINK